MENDQKETYWSRFAADFEEKQRHVVGKEVIALTMEAILKEQSLGVVLELGCGTGLYTETLQKVADNIIATDFSDEMIEAAHQKRGDIKNITFMKANALHLPFEEERFDTVFMANLIHVIEDPDKVMKESKRVLKKRGQIIITSFAMDQMHFLDRLSLLIKYLTTFGKPSRESLKVKTSKDSIEALLVNNGFTITNSKVLGKRAKAIYINGLKE